MEHRLIVAARIGLVWALTHQSPRKNNVVLRLLDPALIEVATVA